MCSALYKRAKVGQRSTRVPDTDRSYLAERSEVECIESAVAILPAATPEQALCVIQELYDISRDPSARETIVRFTPLPSILLESIVRLPTDTLSITCNVVSNLLKSAENSSQFPDSLVLSALASVCSQLEQEKDTAMICQCLRFAKGVARLNVPSAAFEQFLPILESSLDAQCPTCVVHRVFRLCCQIICLDAKMSLLFFRDGFLARAVKSMSTAALDAKAFRAVCEFIGRLCVNENEAVTHMPSDFVDVCAALLPLGNDSLFSLLQDLTLSRRLLIAFCQEQFTARVFEAIENSPFAIARRAAAFSAALMQEYPEQMLGPVVGQGSFYPLLRLFEAEYLSLMEGILAGIATMTNFFIADRPCTENSSVLLGVFQNSPGLIQKLQDIVDTRDPLLIVEAAELILGIINPQALSS
jgi:hypothetical protein